MLISVKAISACCRENTMSKYIVNSMNNSDIYAICNAKFILNIHISKYNHAESIMILQPRIAAFDTNWMRHIGH